MIHFAQFRDLIVRPVCDAFPKPAEATTLLMRIAAHESLGGHFLRQVGNQVAYGPGRGPWQMEPETLSLVERWGEKQGPDSIMQQWEWIAPGGEPHPDALQWDLRLAAWYARVLLYASKWTMPEEGDEEDAFWIYRDVWRPGKPPTSATFHRRYHQWREGKEIT